MFVPMLRGLLTPMLTTAIVAAGALSANAQNAPRVIGEISGMTAYLFDGVEGVWLVTPDGQKIINGMVYDLSGQEPEVNFGTAEQAEIPEFLQRQAPGEPEAPEAEQSSADVDPATTESASDFVGRALAEAEAGLAGVDNERKRELLIDLVSRMDRATSPEEFRLLILEWQADIQGDDRSASSARDAIDGLEGSSAEPVSAEDLPPVPDRAAIDGLAETIAGIAPQAMMPTSPNPLVDGVLSSREEAAGDPDKPDDLLMLDLMRHEGFWFAVGATEAPVVYAFIDPMCPYCARAIENLNPELQNGSLQLRVLLAPAISRAAPAKIAAILTSDDPVQAFLNHEIEYAQRGASSLRDVDFAELSPAMESGIRANYDMIHENGLPGVPFFAYETAEGIRFLSGVPQPGHFAEALPDAFAGTIYTNQ